MAMRYGSRLAQSQPGLPMAAQLSRSNGAGRAAIVELIIEVPPTSLPRGRRSARPPRRPARSRSSNPHSYSGRPGTSQLVSPLTANSGIWAASSGKSGPASSSSTRRAESSLSRAAATPPADPAPTTMTSNVSAI